GWLGRRGGVDLMVAMNQQTWDADIAEIEPGGFLFYDSTRPIPASKLRADVTTLCMPLTAMCNERYKDARQRQVFKNIIYVGALSQLLGLERDVVAQLIAEQYKGKEKLLQPNLDSLDLGRAWAKENLPSPFPLSVERRDKVGERIFIDGNAASALGALYGGATVAAWYPITPSSSLAEAFQKYCGKYRVNADGTKRFAIVQAEDELASIGMVIGAAWNGARAFTATSGPGISLMQEFLGLAYFAEIPAVIFDVQRGGPSTGMPTRTQQADLLSCAYASHGDTKHVMVFPEDPKECFDLGAQAFDLADRLQTPVFVMLDLDIGMNDRICAPFAWDDSKRMDRGKVLGAKELDEGRPFGRYRDVDEDGITVRTWPGSHATRGSFFTRGTTKDRDAKYSEAGPDYIENMTRLQRKFTTAARLLPQPVLRAAAEPTSIGVVYYGSTSPAMDEALVLLAAEGLHLDALRVRGFPFADSVAEFVTAHETVFLVEQNRDAQMKLLLVHECQIDPNHVTSVLHYDGTPITARFIVKAIRERCGRTQVKTGKGAANGKVRR
ncbi:MAG TPA: 2-oxoacid:acceptor oxidoreductase subunit alpha, partial [Planctomycetota bacterium]|nr:2-oxoacid:acceptor oxidoreductase subunit alpha [Planctomycetota bacterium]